jgi:hypothetical protein
MNYTDEQIVRVLYIAVESLLRDHSPELRLPDGRPNAAVLQKRMMVPPTVTASVEPPERSVEEKEIARYFDSLDNEKRAQLLQRALSIY